MYQILNQQLSKMKIFVVDEDEDVLATIASLFHRKYIILTQKGGEDFFEKLDEFQPDLVLLEFMVSEGKGIELCREMKENEKYREIPVIFLTVNPSEPDLYAAFEAGAIDFIRKPFSNIEILSRINAALKTVSSIRELKSLNKVKDNFISMVSHDIKTPLTSIIGFSELLLEEKISGPLTEKQTKFVQQIIDAANHQNQIVKDLLNYSLLESGRMGLHIQKHRLNSILYKIYPGISIMIKRKRINYVNKISDEVYGWFDEDRIMQVLENLIANAVKFTTENGIIEVGGYRKDGMLKVYVKDTGKGISQENLSKILGGQQLFTTQGTNGEKGTGLGISICSLIIKEHSGELFIESQPDQGTTVSFTLPDQQPNENSKSA